MYLTEYDTYKAGLPTFSRSPTENVGRAKTEKMFLHVIIKKKKTTDRTVHLCNTCTPQHSTRSLRWAA